MNEDRVDGLDAHLDVTALGTTIRLRFTDSAGINERARVVTAWSGALTMGEDPRVEVQVEAADCTDWGLSELSSRVTLAAIERQQGRLLMFHAAGIAVHDGRVLIFVGPSGSGKTTLATALSRKYGYVSDEAVGVTSDLRVLSYRKPFSVVTAGEPKRQVAPAEAGALGLPDAQLRLAGIVLLERHAESIEPFVEALTLTQGLVGLATEMSCLSLDIS